MPQQELNLLQLTTAAVAQLRAGSPQVVRCNMLQAHSLTASLDYVPHDILRDAFPHTVPARATARKILPSITLAATTH
jgi:hypothetical protein